MATEVERDAHREPCPECGTETSHRVSIELRVESDDEQNRAFSKEPYRVSSCRACGHEHALRMNNE